MANTVEEVQIDFKVNSSALNGVGKKLSSIGSKMSVIGIGIGVAVAAGAAKIVDSVAAAGDRIDKLSQQLSLSRSGFQKWDYILSQAGMSIDSLKIGMKTLTQRIDEASEGAGKGAEAFEELGISIDESMSQEDIFDATIEALQDMEDGTEKTMIAQDLFGRSGQDLLPLLNGTAKGTQKLKDEFEDLGLGIEDSAVDAAAAYTDLKDKLKRQFGAIAALIGTKLMPAFKKMGDRISEIVKNNGPAIDKFAEWLPTILKVVGGIATFLIAAGTLLKILGTIEGVAAAVGSAIAFLATPPGWVITAFALLGGAIAILIGKFGNLEGMKTTAGKIFKAVKSFVQSNIDKFKEYFKLIMTKINPPKPEEDIFDPAQYSVTPQKRTPYREEQYKLDPVPEVPQAFTSPKKYSPPEQGPWIAWETLYTRVQRKIEEGMKKLEPIFEAFSNNITKQIEKVKASPAWHEIEKSIGKLGAAFLRLFEVSKPLIVVLGAIIVGAFTIIVAAIGPVVEGLLWLVSTVISIVAIIVDFFALLVATLTNNHDAMVASAKAMGKNLLEAFESACQAIGTVVIGFFDNLLSIVDDMFPGIGEAVENGLKLVKEFFVGAFDTIKTVVSDALGFVGGLIDKILGKKSALAKPIDINYNIRGATPNFTPSDNANGTKNFGGGWSMVGERGRELIKMPRGSQVMNNQKTESALSGGGGSNKSTMDIHLSGSVDINTPNGSTKLSPKAVEKIITTSIINNMTRFVT